jgi:hypothetical protein
MELNRDIEILLEMIADNLELLSKKGDFDKGIFEDICNKLNWGLDKYLYNEVNRPGRFKPEKDSRQLPPIKVNDVYLIELLNKSSLKNIEKTQAYIKKINTAATQMLGVPKEYFDKK